jgi:acetylornithine deacetylase
MNKEALHTIIKDAVALLQQLISIPSLSKEENETADCLREFLEDRNIITHRLLNNIWAVNKYADSSKPSILLNSHHDTVPPNAAYAKDPFQPIIQEGKLFGLGSSDAGASLVSLAAAFVYLYNERDLPYNLVFAASAEEEISGVNGIQKLFEEENFAAWFKLPGSFALVGEPTQTELAIAEKGLLVLDCEATGKAGHAARDEGENAIYKAMEAINWFSTFQFEKVSPLLGPVKMTVTAVNTLNKAHNVVPAQCSFVVDIRLTELYTHAEILDIIKQQLTITITPRGTRLHPSSIPVDHPVVKAGVALGKKMYGSPTTSDQALIPLPSLKCGPGFSGQSHSADEFVLLSDIEEGIAFYIALMQGMGMEQKADPGK